MGQVKTWCRRWEISGKRRKADKAEVKAVEACKSLQNHFQSRPNWEAPVRERERERRLDKRSGIDRFNPQQLAVKGENNSFMVHPCHSAAWGHKQRTGLYLCSRKQMKKDCMKSGGWKAPVKGKHPNTQTHKDTWGFFLSLFKCALWTKESWGLLKQQKS